MKQYVILDATCGRFLRSFSDEKPWGEWIDEVVSGHNQDESFLFVKSPMIFTSKKQAQIIIEQMLKAIREGKWDEIEDDQEFSEDQVSFDIIEARCGNYVYICN